MASTIKIKNSSTTGAVPTSSDLVQGELAINVTDTGVYTENASGTVVKLNAPSIDDKNTGATKHVTIDSSGNLGLGVTPSAWSGFKALQIGAGGALANPNSLTRVDLTTNAYYNGSQDTYIGTGAATSYRQNGGQHIWYYAASGTAGNAISYSEGMRLDASGNLLVGGTSLSNPAGWSKGVQVNNANYPFLSIKNSTRQYDLAGFGGDLYFWDATAGAARMVLDSSGNLLVGTNSVPSSSVKGWAVLPYANGCYVTSAINSTGTLTHYEFVNPNGSVGRIDTSGSSTSYVTSSDYRLKKNIAPMTGALATVAQLKPCTYTWKADGSDGQGFIAHELQAVVPDAVVGAKDAVDEDGNPKYQGIDTSFLVATLTAAIQELKAELDAAKARITTLEAA